MFCLASKYHRVSQNIFKIALDIDRHKPQSIAVARIPVILFKYMSDCAKETKGGDGKSNKQIVYKPYVKPVYKEHDYKNMGLKRPMSPHLTIYGPTLPAAVSISQRITGVIATFYALMLSFSALFLSNGVDSLVSAIQSLKLGGMTIFLLKLIIGAPFSFHYFNGIRYVMFNLGKWLSIKEVYASATRALMAAAVLTAFFALL